MTEALRIVAATLVGTLATAVVAGVPLSLASQWGDASRSVPDLAVGVLLAVAVSWLGGLWYIALPSALGWYVTWRFAFDGVRDPLRRHAFAAWAGATFAIALNALQGRPARVGAARRRVGRVRRRRPVRARVARAVRRSGAARAGARRSAARPRSP